MEAHSTKESTSALLKLFSIFSIDFLYLYIFFFISFHFCLCVFGIVCGWRGGRRMGIT